MSSVLSRIGGYFISSAVGRWLGWAILEAHLSDAKSPSLEVKRLVLLPFTNMKRSTPHGHGRFDIAVGGGVIQDDPSRDWFDTTSKTWCRDIAINGRLCPVRKNVKGRPTAWPGGRSAS